MRKSISPLWICVIAIYILASVLGAYLMTFLIEGKLGIFVGAFLGFYAGSIPHLILIDKLMMVDLFPPKDNFNEIWK